MRWISMPRWRAIVAGIAIAVLGGLVLGGVFILSGFYNVAASARHFEFTNAIIRLTLRRSIATHSIGVEAPSDLANEGLARLGARHFELGCAPCHASPATTQNPIASEMYPAAPPLSEAANHWRTEELFWIVKNGLKFTGMPAWPGVGRDQEVWALTAFLERLPDLDAQEYAGMAGAVSDPTGTGADRFDFGESGQDVMAMCDACHGGPGERPVHPLVPTLAGQKADYFSRSLADYAEDRRQSGIMEPIAAQLGAQTIARLADTYSRREGIAPVSASDSDAVSRGENIARAGVPEDDIPACMACHATDTSGHFPRLDGLPAPYIVNQLSLFAEGVREESTYAEIMAPIAQRLSDKQMEDVAAYFASRTEKSERQAGNAAENTR